MGIFDNLVNGLKATIDAARTFIGGGPAIPLMPSEETLEDPRACWAIRACNAAYTVLESTMPEGVASWLGPRDDGVAVAATPVPRFGRSPINRDAAFAALFPTYAIVAFRGTLPPVTLDLATIEDWLNNARAGARDEPAVGHLHQGFWESFSRVWTPIQNLLNMWERAGLLANRPLIVTGHSKGGAMAFIAAATLVARYRDNGRGPVPAVVYTFAAPRAGLDDFAGNYAAMGISTFRYENTGDLVPHLPPTQVEIEIFDPLNNPVLNRLIGHIDRYRPVGTLMYLHEDGTVETPATPDMEQALEKARAERFASRPSELPAFLANLAPNHVIFPDSRYFRAACQLKSS